MKLYIHNKPFRYFELLKYQKLINFNLRLEGVNSEDLLMIVSKDTEPNNYFDIPVFKNIKNKIYFNDTIYIGSIIEESKFSINNKTFYIYKLNKKEYKQNARQKHGFLYEQEIIELNELENLPNIAKWDAYGSLNRNFLDYRINDEKEVHYTNDGNNSLSIEYMNDNEWNTISNKFKKEHFWSVKCMAYKTDIEMGDFKRISGLSIDSNGNVVHKKTDVEDFFMMVSFHDNTEGKKILEEYLIYLNVKTWESYLPKKMFFLENNEYLFSKMYREINDHRLIGERTNQTEENWDIFKEKYRNITEDSIIRLRFKRDTKGQLRIQSAISYNNFKNVILKNPHIKII